jgi:hypothetical protein
MRRKNQKIAFLIDNIPVHIVLDKTQEKLNTVTPLYSEPRYSE